LVATKVIRVETRTWRTDPGPLAIHAARSRRGMSWCQLDEYSRGLRRKGLDPRGLPFGAIVGVCDVKAVRSTDDWQPEYESDQGRYGDFSPGRWAWLLGDIVALAQPIPVAGRQGTWRLSDATRALLAAQLAS
jgi:hypothetical protein